MVITELPRKQVVIFDGSWVRIPLSSPMEDLMKKNKTEMIKLAIVLFVLVVAFGIVIIQMLIYTQEGEKNMPFNLTEIIVVSSAEGIDKAENPENYKWNLDIMQYNDIYLQISKNEDYDRNAYIESVRLENFSFSTPKIGNTRIYMPNSTEERLFSYDDNFLINRTLTYNGADESNSKTLEISSQGGKILFRAANTDVGDLVSNENLEIAQDGTIISNTSVTMEDLKYNISFDLVIDTNITTYRGNISLELPCGDIISNGTAQLDEKDCSNIIFKRENS